MEAKRCHWSWLGDLPFDVLIQITGNVAATLWFPLEDLHALWGTCRFTHRMCRNNKVDRRINLGRVSSSNKWRSTKAYQALLHRLTNIDNP